MKPNHTIAFVGDVMLGRGVDTEIAYRRPDSFWGTTAPLLRSTDGVIANLECAITSSKQRWVRTPKMFHFRARPAATKILEAGNISCVSLANNHILDFCERGLLDTLRHLDAADIGHAGAGKTRTEAAMPAFVRFDGLLAGVVAITDNERSFAATETEAGTFFLDIEAEPNPRAQLMPLAAAIRHEGADLAILSLHWGSNMTTAPPDAIRTFAHAAIDCGFDIVHGHSAHLVHGVETYHDRLILYDTGDFLDDYAVDDVLRNDQSMLFLVDIVEKRVQRLRMVPVRLGFGRVDLAKATDRDEIAGRMIAACQALGTGVSRSEGELEVAIAGALVTV